MNQTKKQSIGNIWFFPISIVIVIYTYWTSPSDDRGWNAFGTTLQTYLTPLSGFNGMIYLSKTSWKHGLD